MENNKLNSNKCKNIFKNDFKNLIKYLKEIYGLKSKIKLDYNNFKYSIDLYNIYEGCKTKEIPKLYENGEVFSVKYLDRLDFPKIPEKLTSILDSFDNEKINLKENIELESLNLEIKELYFKFKEKYNEIFIENNKIKKNNEIFNNLHRYKEDIEKLELPLEVKYACGLLKLKKEIEGKIYNINRHLFEIKLDIVYDIEKRTIKLIIKEDTKFVFNEELLNQKCFHRLSDNLSKINDLLVNGELIKTNLIDLMTKIGDSVKPFGKVQDELNMFDKEKMNLYNHHIIFVDYKDSKIWYKDLQNINDLLENEEINIENDFARLVLAKDEDEIIELLEKKKSLIEEEIYFPLSSNEAQFEIAEKTLNNNSVLVQGPPGTGKSHTIVNLISYFMAKGNKILVTSEKGNALNVLSDKMPNEIKSLSLSLTQNKKDDNLEFSIKKMLEQYSQKDVLLKEYTKSIPDLKERLKEIRKSLRRNIDSQIKLKDLETISNNEFLKKIKFEFNGNSSLMDISKYLSGNSRILDDEIDICKDINCNIKGFNKIEPYIEYIQKNKDLIRKIKDNFMENIITPQKFEEQIKVYEYELKKFPEYLIYLQNFKLDNLNNSKIDEIYNDIKRINGFNNKFSNMIERYNKTPLLKKWLKKYIEQINIEEIKTNNEFLFDYDLEISDEFYNQNYSDIIDYLSNLKELDKIPLLDNFTKNELLKKIKSIKINKKELDINSGDFKIILKYFKYRKQINDYIEILNIKIPEYKVEPKYMNFYEELLIHIKNLEYLINLDEEKIKIKNNVNLIFTDITRLKLDIEDFEKLENILKKLKSAYIIYNFDKNIEKEINQNINNISFSKELAEEYQEALIKRDLEKYNYVYIKFQELSSHIKKINEFKNICSNLIEVIPNTIENYIYNYSKEKRNDLANNLNQYTKNTKLYLFYKNKIKEVNNIENLEKEYKQLQKEEKKIILELINKETWEQQLKSIKNIQINALNSWCTLKNKLGKGTGKKAFLYKKEMQKHIDIAKSSIPVWIMPVEDVLEQFPMNKDGKKTFDIIIIDESSQSSILSFPVLLRAKKVIIVGDNKQVSPTTVGINTEDINRLQRKYLTETKLGCEFDLSESIYDRASQTLATSTVMLKEHFRCLPEIIQFSNINYYNNEIIPLKFRNFNSKLQYPIIEKFVENAYVVGSTSSSIYNPLEAEEIVKFIIESQNNLEYENKTFGIVTLQGNAQKEKLHSLLLERIGIENFERLNLKIGNPKEFQGDERDIILLSMVIADKMEDGTKKIFRAITSKSYEQAYNVAVSRAKEQLVLFHSVNLSALSKDCQRYKLLDYCIHYKDYKYKIDSSEYDSEFEKEVFSRIIERGYKAKTQVAVGKYKIDIVIEDENGRLAVECDGDRWHGPDVFRKDIERQNILERAGFTFWRVRGSVFYADKEKALESLWNKLNEMKILPSNIKI